MLIEQATIADAKEILDLQKLAYQSEAAIYNDSTIPPLTQTLEEMCAEFATQTVLKASIDGKIIGSVRAWLADDTCYIGRVIVHPDFQNQGIGAKFMQAVENFFPTAKRYELFTGYKSARNLHFYQKLGYRIFKQEDLNENVKLVYLEKFSQSC